MLRRLFGKLRPADATRGPRADPAVERAERLLDQGRNAERSGRLGDAGDYYREAISVAPQHPPAHLNLGAVIEAAGDFEGALRCYRAALRLDPKHPAANYNLGRLYFLRGADALAEPFLRAAIENRPDFAEALVILGTLFRKLGRDAEAESVLARAAAIDSSNPDIHRARFDLAQARGDLEAALTHLQFVLKLQPDRADALYSYGTVLMGMQRLDEAVVAFQSAIAIDRRFAQAYRMCASVLHRLGRIDEMIDVCRAGCTANPERFDIESFELLGLNFVDGLSAAALFARHRSFGERLETAVPRRFSAFRQSRDPDRRLKIGFLSGDFSYHPVSLFLIPFIERLDKAKLEIVGYHVATTSDAITTTLRSKMDQWRGASAMSEAELANAVYSDGIDILVDLSGHTGVARLGVFAQQPAPVQATWLGYPNTTGLTRIQYRISDAVCAPPGIADQWNTEKVVRLPHSYFCYRPFFSVAPSARPPLEKNGFVTFGVFTQIAKLNSRMRTRWAEVLRQVPDSRLVIAGVTSALLQAALIEDLRRDGIDPARVQLLPFMPVQEYLRAFDTVDFVLDTSPYSGGTTSCDALWMGVPVLTLPGEWPVSRTAASVLTTVGLTDWIANSPEDYLARAVRFATDRRAMVDLRGSLRARMEASPLMQEGEFAKEMEKAFRAMWRAWCTDAAS